MLEELRVGLFAQRLGTAETVSVQRIQKALNS
jgi:ATP-dependent helicase HrpA